MVHIVTNHGAKKIRATFFKQPGTDNEPVRDWLKSLPPSDRKLIGKDIATCEYGWPIGMPTCRPMGDGLHEIRTDLPDGMIARVFFCVGAGKMYLLHGIVKKSQTTPKQDLALARKRKKMLGE